MKISTMEEALEFARTKEKSANQFYSDLSKRTSDSQLKQLFEELARDEASHETSLEDLKESLLSEDRTSSIPSLAESPQLSKLEEPVTPLERSIAKAIKSEQESKALYHDLARIATNNDVRRFFEGLSVEEQAHAEKLMKHYRSVLLMRKSTPI